MPAFVSRDRLAVLAALVAPLAVAAVLVPFRSSFPNTDAALVLLLVVVAVAANGYRLAGFLAAVSVAVTSQWVLTAAVTVVDQALGGLLGVPDQIFATATQYACLAAVAAVGATATVGAAVLQRRLA